MFIASEKCGIMPYNVVRHQKKGAS